MLVAGAPVAVVPRREVGLHQRLRSQELLEGPSPVLQLRELQDGGALGRGVGDACRVIHPADQHAAGRRGQDDPERHLSVSGAVPEPGHAHDERAVGLAARQELLGTTQVPARGLVAEAVGESRPVLHGLPHALRQGGHRYRELPPDRRDHVWRRGDRLVAVRDERRAGDEPQ